MLITGVDMTDSGGNPYPGQTSKVHPVSEPNTPLMSTLSSTSGHSSSQQNTGMDSGADITVNKPSKVEIELAKKEVHRGSPSKAIVVFKWVATLFMCALCYGCLVVSKFTFSGVAAQLEPDDDGPDNSQKAFTMVLVLLLGPNVLNLIRSMWMGLFRKDMPWPSKKTILLLFVFSVLESFGICLFAYKVLSLRYGLASLTATNGIYIVPILSCIIQQVRSGSNTTSIKMLCVLALLLSIIGTGITMYDTLNNEADWHLPAAIFVLTFCWTPYVQEKLVIPAASPNSVEPNTPSTQSSSNFSGSRSRYEKVSTASDSMNFTSYSQEQLLNIPKNTNTGPEEKVVELSCWKSTIVLCFFRILFIFAFSFVLFYVDRTDTMSASAAFEAFKGGWSWSLNEEFTNMFIINIVTTFFGYFVALSSCRVCMQKGAFIIPIILASPTVLLWQYTSFCSDLISEDICENSDMGFIIAGTACSFLAIVLSFGVILWKTKIMVLQMESELYWLPAYPGVLLEEWLFLGRRNKKTEDGHFDPHDLMKKTKIYICTTMYRETREEMKQLLESIGRVNQAQATGQRFFESHIFFDGGVTDKVPTDFALQLISLLPSTLGIDAIETCTKSITPYGLSLCWRIPLPDHLKGKQGMLFMIHLKDNRKVKNKKRWSQIMYMSYVLDFLVRQSVDENGRRTFADEDTFILTTDADVRFTPNSVEALLDLMTRDKAVGAVCARTHPLGSGPLVWYQVFEYAIGHWFQKAAEHVLGSVLCAPGCFSVYRVKAVRDIVSTYASNVEQAFDFLIKDMGEDRWFCTLMVQSGWRIEYCATSENSTHCPEEFEEFYKQRRRWIASTIANLILLMKEWRKISRFNNRVSFLFTIYQGFLLVSTLIGPSVVILVVAGGLLYGWGVDVITMIILQSLVSIGFALICLFTSETTQMSYAKVLTFIYACIMMAVAVGTAQQAVNDLTTETLSPQGNTSGASPTINPSDISESFQVSLTTIYLGGLIGMFFVTGLCHPREFFCLAHGIWYLLCLPSGYLVLNIYSIANITDRSWGTREEKEKSAVKDTRPWYERGRDILKTLFFCCDKTAEKTTDPKPQGNIGRQQRPSFSESTIGQKDISETARRIPSTLEESTDEVDGDVAPGLVSQISQQSDLFLEDETPIPVEEWIDRDFRDEYVELFKKHGFDNTLFISGMLEKDLVNIGIKQKAHITWLLEEIKELPTFSIETKVPDDVYNWLVEIGLERYYKNFKQNKMTRAKDLEVLKSFTRADIERELKITKGGHVKRLLKAIKHLRKPSAEELQRMQVKKDLENAILHKQENINKQEVEFWEELKEACLQPSSVAFGHNEELKVKLGELRNNFLLILAIANTLWLILLSTLATKMELKVIGSDPIGLVFLAIFGFIFVLQFLCMFVHRLLTLGHFCARAPYKFGQPFLNTWSFKDSKSYVDLSQSTNDQTALAEVREAEVRIRTKLRMQGQNRRKNLKFKDPETTPILSNQPNGSAVRYTHDTIDERV